MLQHKLSYTIILVNSNVKSNVYYFVFLRPISLYYDPDLDYISASAKLLLDRSTTTY